MRILIAARHSPNGRKPIGGVQSWSATVGQELVLRGHDVCYWEPGLPLTGHFDFGIVANYCDTRDVLKFCRSAVSVSHGIIEPEKPYARNAVFTSEEVRDYWDGRTGAGDIIRQPINTSFWSPSEQNTQKYLTRFSYRFGLTFMPQVARSKRLDYRHIHNSTPHDVRRILRQSACVLATGRAALEAMACGVPVLICDHRESYQEALMDIDVVRAMRRNYSGRGGITPTLDNVAGAIDIAIKEGSLREHVLTHHKASDIVDQLLEKVE